MAEKPYYKFLGPLDPEDPNQVCNDRVEDVRTVIEGIQEGDFWTILGSRQIGKTTFLSLIKKEFKQAYYINFDFEVTHDNENSFYRWLIRQFLEKIPHKAKFIWWEKFSGWGSPALNFFYFLIKFKPEKAENKIILLIDEVDGLPFLENFLRLWRKVFHERHYYKVLSRYTIITTGSVELVKLAIGHNSPFNIAQKIYIRDFSEEESRKMIEKPFAQLNIQIESKAKQNLLSQISGHPQMLQHVCHILVKNAKPGVKLTDSHLNDAIKNLSTESPILNTLKEDIMKYIELKNLVRDILIKKEKRAFNPYSEYGLLGAGAIKEVDSYCKIRNKIYERLLRELLREKRIVIENGKVKKKTSFLKHFVRAITVTGVIIALVVSILKVISQVASLSWILVIFLAICIFILVFLLSRSEEKENQS